MTVVQHRFSVWEDSGISLMARVVGDDGDNAQQADVDAIAYSVYYQRDPTTATATGTLNASDVIFDTLQTDSRWTEDSVGYNFRWDVPASIFANGGGLYTIEIAITPSTGEVYHLVYQGRVREINRS